MSMTNLSLSCEFAVTTEGLEEDSVELSVHFVLYGAPGVFT